MKAGILSCDVKNVDDRWTTVLTMSMMGKYDTHSDSSNYSLIRRGEIRNAKSQ